MGHRLLKKPFFLALAAGLILPVGAGVVAPAAQAQFSDSYNFLKAVRDRKGEEAEKFLPSLQRAEKVSNSREESATDEGGNFLREETNENACFCTYTAYPIDKYIQRKQSEPLLGLLIV